MSDCLLHNAKVVLPAQVVHGGVVIRDDRIVDLFLQNTRPSGFARNDTRDAGERYLAPGFIDIHIHGSAGIDLQETDREGLATLSKFLLGKGVTGYFPTLVPAEPDAMAWSLGTIDSYAISGYEFSSGARVLGVHFEGPFVSKKRCGALHPAHFRVYDGAPKSIDLFTPQRANHRQGGPGLARLMTVAPEVEGSISLIRDLTARGVRCSIGHSTADPQTLDRAAEAGAHHITHFPNALDPLHHRRPGAVAWGLVREDITMDCIADLEHIDPLMLRLMYQAKGAARMSLISDAIKPAGLGDGIYDVWGDKIAVNGNRTSLAHDQVIPIEQRTIAGSVITLDQCVKNVISLGVPLHEAIHMASLGPARAAGLDADFGSIAIGKRADLILFEDNLSQIQPAFSPGRPHE